MSRPVVQGNRLGAGGGLISLLVAVAAVVGTVVWLLVRDSSLIFPGYVGGPVAMLAAVFSLHRIGATVFLPRPVRAFWSRLSHAGISLFIGTSTSLLLANNNAGMSPFVAVPMVGGAVLAMLAFVHLPIGPRGPLGWVRALLDGATVAVAGSLIFAYVVQSFVPEGTPMTTRAAAGAVGVAALLAFVVIGRAAMNPEGQVDPLSLRALTLVPAIAVAASVLLIAGTEESRLWLSVLAAPGIGLSFCAAAYRQRLVLSRPGGIAVRHEPRAGRGVLPFLAVTATAVLVISVSARDLDGSERFVIIGAALMAALVVARQLLGLRENKRLLEGLRVQQAELERMAMTDPLTGLANRTRFGAVLTERLAGHRPATVLLIDIDDFKMVNDTMGPAVGDQLLYEVGQRLRLSSAVHEMPARLGGDEFAVLLDLDEAPVAEAAAARILQALSEPIRVGEHHLLAHASMGIVLAGPGDTTDEVLRNADIAMYAAKEGGKAAWTRFEPKMRQDVVNNARLGSELHNAIIRHELFLLYQPVFDIVTGRLHGVEALVRWKHPSRGFVSPGDFIPVAERSGLIVPLGAWVLREACRQLAAWKVSYGDGAIKAINVNVAVRQLRESGFVDEVAAALSEHGLLPHNLVLEVTESSVADGRQVRETLHALHEMGVRLALDDFGTGQSSLSLLRAFPVDVLKLDKSFVDGIADGEDRGRLAVAAAVAQLAEYLQLSAVAEGIESEAQLDRLRDMGYRLGQGFFMAKPLPPDEAGALMGVKTPLPTAGGSRG
ncbi:MAG: bifunctional diguanylate cyclase/phosphodiesterase [Actinoplanes sp.]